MSKADGERRDDRDGDTSDEVDSHGMVERRVRGKLAGVSNIGAVRDFLTRRSGGFVAKSMTAKGIIGRFLRQNRRALGYFGSIVIGEDFPNRDDDSIDVNGAGFQQYLHSISEIVAAESGDIDVLFEIIEEGDVELELMGACMEFLGRRVVAVSNDLGSEDSDVVERFLELRDDEKRVPRAVRHIAQRCLDSAVERIKYPKILTEIGLHGLDQKARLRAIKALEEAGEGESLLRISAGKDDQTVALQAGFALRRLMAKEGKFDGLVVRSGNTRGARNSRG